MKKIAFSLVAFIALSSNVIAGGDIMPASTAVPLVLDDDHKDADGLYVGIAYSHMSHDLDFQDRSTNVELDYHGIMINLGYKFNPYIAVEGRYNGSLDDNDQDDYTESSDITVWSLFVKPMYPLAPEMDIYGLVGYSLTEVDNDFEITSMDEGSFSWGAGGSYAMTEDFSLFAEYTQFYNDTLNGFDHVIDSFNIGVFYTF